jgi:hypothetical protein
MIFFMRNIFDKKQVYVKMSVNSFEQTRAFVKQNHIYNPQAQLANNLKTKMCDSIVSGRRCEFGFNCSFAHSTSELRKKVCVFNSKGVCTVDNCGFDHSVTTLPKKWQPITRFVPNSREIIHNDSKNNLVDDELEKIESLTNTEKKNICKRLYEKFQQRIITLLPFAKEIMSHFFETFDIEKLHIMYANFSEFEKQVKNTYKINQNSAQTRTDSPIPEKTSISNKKFSWIDGLDEEEYEEEIRDDIQTELNRHSFTPSIGLQKSEIVPDHLTPFNTYKDYELYHINEVNINSPDEVKNVRGIICKGDTVVCKAFSFTNEFNINDEENFNKYIPSDDVIQNSIVLDSYEGTVVRYWYDDESWHLSTYRKIDAGQSKWNNSVKTYLDYFISCLGRLNIKPSELYKNLDKNKVYVFQITNDKENRMVVGDVTQEIYCLGSFDRNKNFKYSYIAPETGIQGPKEHKILSRDELKQLVQSTDKSKKIGISCITADGVIIKIINEEYNTNREIRGQASNVFIRYLEVRFNDTEKKKLFQLFPETVKQFNELEVHLKEFVRDYCFKLYKLRFYMSRSDKLVDNIVNKYNYITVINNSHLKFLHSIHDILQSKKETKNIAKSKLALHHIWSVIDETDKKSLYFMVKNYGEYNYTKINY